MSALRSCRTEERSTRDKETGIYGMREEVKFDSGLKLKLCEEVELPPAYCQRVDRPGSLSLSLSLPLLTLVHVSPVQNGYFLKKGNTFGESDDSLR